MRMELVHARELHKKVVALMLERPAEGHEPTWADEMVENAVEVIDFSDPLEDAGNVALLQHTLKKRGLRDPTTVTADTPPPSRSRRNSRLGSQRSLRAMSAGDAADAHEPDRTAAARRVPRAEVEGWSAADVGAWLEGPLQLGQYARGFAAGAVDGARLLALDQTLLARAPLGVTDALHRRKILARVAQMVGRPLPP